MMKNRAAAPRPMPAKAQERVNQHEWARSRKHSARWWDGLDPQDLYAQNHPVNHASWEWKVSPPATGPDDPRLPDAAHLAKFYNRTLDLINRYDPDLVYFDDTLAAIGAWLGVNGEAIHATRPWEVFGEGPAEEDAAVHLGTGEVVEKKVRPLGARDIRYTRSKDGGALHAIVLGWPADRRVVLGALAAGSARHSGGIGRVTLLGSDAAIAVRRDAEGLILGLPATRPVSAVPAYVFRIGLTP